MKSIPFEVNSKKVEGKITEKENHMYIVLLVYYKEKDEYLVYYFRIDQDKGAKVFNSYACKLKSFARFR